MLGSTATTSDRHFMALVLTAMALSPSTLRICAGAHRKNLYAETCSITFALNYIFLPVINKYQSSVQTASLRPDI